MFHKIALVIVSLIALAIGAFGCGSQSNSTPATSVPPTNAPAAVQPTTAQVAATSAPTNAPTSAPAAANPTQAASTSGKKLYACSLLSPQEAEAIIGKALENIPSEPQSGSDDIQSICKYKVKDAPASTAALSVVRYPDADYAHKGMEENKDFMLTVFKAKAENLSGLGDEAFWAGEAPDRHLNVRQNEFILALGFTQAQDAQVEQLAKKMLGHFDDVFIIPPPSVTTAQQKPTSAPATKAAAQPTAQPTKPTPTAANSDSSSASFDGEWKGETSMKNLGGKNIPFTFTIANNKISRVTQDFRVPSGVCEGFSGSGNDHPNVSIQNNAFTVKWENKLSAKSFNKAEITGTFQSPTQATGTMHFSGTSSFCGEYDFEATWTASK